MRHGLNKSDKIVVSANTISNTSEDLIASPMTDRTKVTISHTHATDTLYILPSPATSAATACTTANGIPIPPNQSRTFYWGTDYHITAIRGGSNDIRASVIEEKD